MDIKELETAALLLEDMVRMERKPGEECAGRTNKARESDSRLQKV